MITRALFALRRLRRACWPVGVLLWASASCPADIIWSDLGETLAHETGPGADILNGAVERNDSATDTLYFKFHVNPKSDAGTEPYFAAFELYEGGTERLAVGNALNAWAYGAFNVLEAGKTNFNVFEAGKTNNVNTDFGIDLNSSKPTFAEREFEYELPRTGIERTIVFKVQYVPGGKDLVTVWLDPDLGPGATEASQMTNLTTKFVANASFNQIHLRHGGRGDGWTFSEMAIATSFSDFVLDDGGTKSSHAGLAIGRGQWPFTFRVWQREQGLPQNFVRALAQTKDGYLWVGSDAGVSRFDGARFVPIGLPPEGFQAGPVQTLLGDKQGALWIGSVGRGLGRWQNGKFTALTTQDGLPSDSVNALSEDSAGRLWIGTEAGLVVWQNGHLGALRAARVLAGKPITSLFSDHHGTVWIGAKGAGLFSFGGAQLSQVRDPVFDNLLQDPHCILVDGEGRLWVGAGEDSVLYREGGKQWRRYRLPRHLARHYVSALAEDPDGSVWAGSESEGLFQFKHGKLMAVNASSGLSDNLVETLLVDREGRLWVGTHEGLNRLRPKNLSVISYREGLGHGAVQGLAEVTPGVIWAGKLSEGLYRWDGRYFSSLPAAGLAEGDGRVGALLLARDGSCWMGGAHGLLQFKDTGEIESQPGLPALTNLDICALAQDAQGRLWVGTRQGELWWQDHGQWLKQSKGPRVHTVTALAPERDGSIWVGTAGDGLFNVEGKADGLWTKRSGRLSEWIRTLYLDAEGALWIGTGGGGVSRLEQGKVATFTTREGLPDNTVSQILEDDAGNLWLGGDRGIVCVSKRQLEDLAAQKIAAVYPRVYGRTEGMLSEECISGYFPIGLKTKSGLLWFPTQDGIVVADPHHQTTDLPAPAVVLEETLVDGVPDTAEPLRLAPGKHRLEFRYTGFNFDAPERVRFRYRLEGLDTDWVEAGASRAAPYSYLPPGHYRFHVIACNSDGVWNDLGAGVPLTVLQHLWLEWWFLGLVALGLIGAAGGAIRVIVKRKMQRRLAQLERERVLERERARIAQDLHDDLGSSLTRISLLSGLAREDKDNASQLEIHVNKISQSAAQTLRALEEIVWAIRPGSDSLQSLVEYIAHFANELFEGDGVRCRLDLPADLPARPLPPEMRHSIFLVVKEALTNALKHAGAREVRVQARVAGDALEIIVQDDGQGFDTRGQSRGQGLGNMRRRAQAMGGNVAIESLPGQGTTVRLLLHVAPVHTNGKVAA